MNFANDPDELERHRREDATVELIKSARRNALILDDVLRKIATKAPSLALQKRSEPWLPAAPSLAKIDLPAMNKLGALPSMMNKGLALDPAPSAEEKLKAIYLSQIRAQLALERIQTISYV